MPTLLQPASWHEFFQLDWANSFLQWRSLDEQAHHRVYGCFVESVKEINHEIIFRMTDPTYERINQGGWAKSKRKPKLIKVQYSNRPSRLLIDGQITGAYCFERPGAAIVYPPGIITPETLVKG